MFQITRNICFLVLWLLFSQEISAQPGPSVLPSLFDKQQKKIPADNEVINLLKKRMFVKAFANSHKIFVGEPVEATYKFYVAMNLNGRPAVTKQPEFSGWSVKELNFDGGREVENINNTAYLVYTLRKVQLTPLHTGMLSLGKAFVNNVIEVYDEDDPFTSKKYDLTVSNNDEFVDVNSLPENNKPNDFYGITGNFSISARTSGKEVPVGENDELIITIKGSGNLEAITKPGIVWPENIDHFEGTDSQHINQDNFPVNGDRIFTIPFVGKKEGSSVIPPVKFSFFNTTAQKYETVATDSITVVFTKALTHSEAFTGIVNEDVTNRKYLWIIPAIAMVVASIGFISYRRNKKNEKKKTVNSDSTSVPVFTAPATVIQPRYRTDFSRYLTELNDITDKKQFFEKAKSLLVKAIGERVNSWQQSEQVLLKELRQTTYNSPMCTKVEALFEAINFDLYAPFETSSDVSFYHAELKQVIHDLQDYS